MISRKYNEQMGAYLAKLAQSKPKPTNADRIRAMTEEELASFLNEGCPGYIKEEICQRHKSCPECWLDWLKQEAEGEE